MNPLMLIQIATSLAQVAKGLIPAVAEAKKVLSSDDNAAIEQALIELEHANDELYAEVMAKLRLAAQQ